MAERYLEALTCGLAEVRADGGQFASAVSLVEVYVTVTDDQGAPLTNLAEGDFRVFEDDRPQSIAVFAAGDFPLSVALAIDRSWSMAGDPLALAKAAVRVFLGELRASDRSMLLAVASDTEVVAPLSTDRPAQFRALQAIEPWSTTALYDAIIAGADVIEPAQGRRALVLLSDGIDRYSHASANEALEHARSSDVLVYPIALGKTRPTLFAELAALTGGRSFHLQDPRELSKTFSTIARELRHQYLLGYTSTRPGVPGAKAWRAIRVEVNRKGVHVRARDGYFAICAVPFP